MRKVFHSVYACAGDSHGADRRPALSFTYRGANTPLVFRYRPTTEAQSKKEEATRAR